RPRPWQSGQDRDEPKMPSEARQALARDRPEKARGDQPCSPSLAPFAASFPTAPSPFGLFCAATFEARRVPVRPLPPDRRAELCPVGRDLDLPFFRTDCRFLEIQSPRPRTRAGAPKIVE